MLEGLMALCALPGISGHEGPVRAYLKEALSPLGLEVFTDPMGNLYAHRPGPGPRGLDQTVDPFLSIHSYPFIHAANTRSAFSWVIRSSSRGVKQRSKARSNRG